MGNSPYKFVQELDYVADMVGARVSKDALAIYILDQDGPLDVSGATVPVDLQGQELDDIATNVQLIGGEEQSAVDIAARIKALTEALADAYDGTEQLRVDLENNNAGPLDVSAETVSTDPQGTVTVQEETPVETDPHADHHAWDGEALGALDTVSAALEAVGADRLRGRVESTDTFRVEVEWLDEVGTVIFTEEIESGATSEVGLDEPVISPFINIIVEDEADDGEQVLNGVLHLS